GGRGRRSPPTRAESYNFGDVQGARGGSGRGRRPAPPSDEPYYFMDGRWTKGGASGGSRGPRTPPTRVESFYAADVRAAGPTVRRRSWETGEFSIGLYERQMAGISALLSLANDVAAATKSSETIAAPAGQEGTPGKLSVIARLRQDPMIWNSLFLIMSTGLQAGTGFLFWIITAHLFSVSDVGTGSALVSGAGLIGILALVGLNNGLARYLPNSRSPNALISSSLAAVTVVGAIGGLIYILLTPLIAPDLSFVEKNPVLTIGFALITAAYALNGLTDNVFIAARLSKYVLIVDGVIGGFGKVVAVILLAGSGAYGLFLGSAASALLAAVA